ncbi:MAG: GNAT family N-acetyltransferase [Rhizobiales bacterium]|nr:GNAT family N-acetyltransferase [Hyphomicrobiales bacterium]
MLNVKIDPENGEQNGPQRLITQRLVLRHFTAADAPAIQQLGGDWDVARMLSRMPFPYVDGLAAEWIARHAEMRAGNREFPFAVTLDGTLIGCVGATAHDHGTVEIGYWIGKSWWNQGFATEAARAVIGFAFGHFALDHLVAGHFADNHASGTVLTKLGFRYTGEEQRWCEARQQEVHALTMALQRKDARL